MSHSHTEGRSEEAMTGIPRKIQQRHAQVIKLMSGALGQIFDGHLLEGRQRQEQTRLMSYFALYYSSQEQDIVFLQLEKNGPAKQAAAQKVRSLSLKLGDARGRFNRLLDAPSPEALIAVEKQLDDAALQQAQLLLRGKDLPIAIIGFHEATVDNSPKIIFWYPTMSQPDRLWQLIKTKVRTAFS